MDKLMRLHTGLALAEVPPELIESLVLHAWP